MLSSGYYQSYINIQIQKANQKSNSIKNTKKSPIRQVKCPSFIKGDKIKHAWTNKTGTIDRLRDDTHERTYNNPKGVYYYSVTYDDNTFQTYENEKNLVKI